MGISNFLKSSLASLSQIFIIIKSLRLEIAEFEERERKRKRYEFTLIRTRISRVLDGIFVFFFALSIFHILLQSLSPALLPLPGHSERGPYISLSLLYAEGTHSFSFPLIFPHYFSISNSFSVLFSSSFIFYPLYSQCYFSFCLLDPPGSERSFQTLYFWVRGRTLSYMCHFHASLLSISDVFPSALTKVSNRDPEVGNVIVGLLETRDFLKMSHESIIFFMRFPFYKIFATF